MAITAWVWLASAGGAEAQTSVYRFVRIADSTQFGGSVSTKCVGVNEAGDVVFVTSDGVIWSSDGATLVRVAEPGPGGNPLVSSCPGLNDNGEVTYPLASQPVTAVVKQSGSTVTPLASSDIAPYLDEPGSSTIHSLSNTGTTVVSAVDGLLYLMPAGTPVFTPLPSDPPFVTIKAGTMNNGHVVVFFATRQVAGTLKAAIYRSSATALIEDGHATVAAIEPGRPVINDAGVVAFLGRLGDGSVHVLSTSDGVDVTDRSGYLGTVVLDALSINSDGDVVFSVLLPGGGNGVFTGPDSSSDRVIGPGDSLDGSTVVSAEVSAESINGVGQIALKVQLANGRSGIYLATPVLPPVANDGTLATTMNTSASGVLSAVDPASLPFQFEIVSGATRGVVTITDASTGAFTYQPNLNSIGYDSFTFRATNGTAPSNVATVSVTISPGVIGNTAPVAQPGGAHASKSVRFDSVSDELSRLTDLPPITSFSMMGWFRFLSDDHNYSAFIRLGDATTSDGYNILRGGMNGSNNLYIWSPTPGIRSGGPIQAGEWYHFALTVEGTGVGQVKLYMNGALVRTVDGSPSVTQERLSIGNDAHDEWLDGNAASVKIYNVPLTQAEIVAEMGQFTPVRSADLNSFYPIQSAADATTDYSGNNFTLTATGTLETDAAGPPVKIGTPLTTVEDAPLDGLLQASDAESNPLQFRIVTGPTKGSVLVNPSSGAFTYTAGVGQTGDDSFTFAVNDGLLDSNVAPVAVSVLPAMFPVTVNVAGTGAGSVTSSPVGITCSAGACTTSFARNTVITLTANASAGSIFAGWSGACSGTGACAVTVAGSVDVTATFDLSSRDLVIASLSDPPDAVTPGARFTATATTLNQGNISANASKTRFYLSVDAQKSPDDFVFSYYLGIPVLAGGVSSTGNASLTIPTSMPLGSYRLLACADDFNVIVEHNETNNCMAADTINVQQADLVVASLSNPPTILAPGGSFSVTETVENRGLINAASSRTRFYLATGSVLSANDILLTAYRTVPALAAGAMSTGTTTLVVPSSAPLGTYRLIACADDLRVVVEIDELNNCLTSAGSVAVSLTDLAEVSVTTTAVSALPGSTISVTDTVANQGNAPAPASVTQYYLSPDGQRSSGTLLTVTRSVPSLQPSATSTGTKTVTVPASIAAGSYYVLACADGPGTIVEVSENNCLATTGTVIIGWPDLVVTAAGAPPAMIAPGRNIAASHTVRNQGPVTSIASTTRHYLSLNTSKSADDILIAYTFSIPSLAAGASASAGASVKVPAATPAGLYYLLTCADDLSRVAEGPNEVNNCVASATTMDVRLPDVVQIAVSNPPATVARGATLTIVDTVTNQGTIATSNDRTNYYLSLDGTKNGAVLLTGYRTIGLLAPGASSTATRSVTVPTTAPAGIYVVLVCADDTNLDVEISEANNCLASAGTTQVP